MQQTPKHDQCYCRVCNKIIYLNKTGICMACRTLECSQCKRKFTSQEVGLMKVCPTCLSKKAKKAKQAEARI